MIVPASTTMPGRSTMRSTRPIVVAGIQRMSSGTSVPRPRTWRTIGPRLTVSIHTVARSTDGAAGFSRESPRVRSATAPTPSDRVDGPLDAPATDVRGTGDVHLMNPGGRLSHSYMGKQ